MLSNIKILYSQNFKKGFAHKAICIMKKLYEKSKLWFALLWIIAYCLLFSVGDSLSSLLEIEKSVTLAIGLGLSTLLLVFLKKNRLLKDHGLCLPKNSLRSMLYYIPILVMLSTNLWYGVTVNYRPFELALYILSMLCVGLLEELIFRGLLFNAMRQNNIKAAVIVSSVTFGIGHVINLVNGSGAELLPNLLQVLYATTAGFMFVMIYYRSESLLVCIGAHGLFNALSAFSNEKAATTELRIAFSLLLAAITGGYAAYLAWSLKKEKNKTVN